MRLVIILVVILLFILFIAYSRSAVVSQPLDSNYLVTVSGGCSVEEVEQACKSVVLSCSCPVYEPCQARNLIIPFEKAGYVFDVEKHEVIVKGVDFVSRTTGNSMLPVLPQGSLVFWKRFSGNYQDLKPNQLVFARVGKKVFAHFVRAIYSDHIVLYGLNNPSGVEETVDLNAIEYVEVKP